jgi:hypothetical protein
MTVSLLATTAGADADETGPFERRVAPLLVRNCLGCHNASDSKGGLNLSTRTTALKGGDSGAVLVPGKPEKTYLIERVTDGSMPPEKHGRRLTKREVADLTAWVKAGANWPAGRTLSPFELTTKHRAGFDWWSLQPLQRPPIPRVLNSGWVQNPVDAFVVSRLKSSGLSPAAPADRRTLIRRLKFDLLGLPPTPSEIDAFLADRSPDAYEKLVDRFLASPHYGERWGRHWLDVVRFGESDGFEHDKLRPHAWRYRDYVIRSLNADKPYDRFVKEQLAGDAMTPRTRDGIAATGFLVAGPWDEIQFVAKSETERRRAHEEEMSEILSAVSQTFLGITANCARCHDHKFDPVLQADYYRMKAVFDGVSHADGKSPGNRPLLTPAEVAAREKRLTPLQKRIAELNARIAKLDDASPGDARPDSVVKDALTDGRFGRALNARATRLTAKSKAAFQSPPFTVECWAKANSAAGFNVFVANNLKSAADHWEVYTFAGSGDFTAYLPGYSPDTIRSGDIITDGKWRYLAMQFDGKTVRLFVDAKLVKEQAVKRIKPAGQPGSLYIGGYSPQNIGCDGAVDELRISTGLREIKRVPTAAFTADQRTVGLWRFDELRAGRVENAAAVRKDRQNPEASRKTIAKRRTSLVTERDTLQKQIDAEPVPLAYIGHRRQPPTTHVLARGNPEKPLSPVQPAGLTGIRSWPGKLPLAKNAREGERRLRFAEWVAHPRNPLTPRVIVNRLWQHHFGQGLVKTPSDFGFNGGRPSHPLLLDWLAAELTGESGKRKAESRWSLKHIQRLIVTSATYRQTSESGKRKAESRMTSNPRSLLRGFPPRRLEGEIVRDAMLAVSGELNTRMHGPSFRPFNVTVFNTHFYHLFDSETPEFNRRTVYRMQISTGRDPFLVALDCPAPSLAAPDRRTTTTPLQALALMNNSFALRQADRFAARVRRLAGEDVAAQVERCYRLAFGRLPTRAESAEGVRFVRANGLPTFCWVLLNSSEFLYVL